MSQNHRTHFWSAMIAGIIGATAGVISMSINVLTYLDIKPSFLNSSVWKKATLVTTLTGHSGLVWSVAFSPDSKTLVSGSSDNTIKIWRAGSSN